jgi:hypothetical protein
MLRVPSGVARLATKPCDRSAVYSRPRKRFLPLNLCAFVSLCEIQDGRNSCSHWFLDHEVIHNELTAGGRVFAHIELQERLDYVAVVDRDVG